MASRDLHNNLHFVPLITPAAARTDDTAIVSAVIDTFGYEGVELALVTGANTDADATFAVLVEDSDASGSGFAAVADAQLIGLESAAGFTFADDGECRKIGYVGIKRYVRMTVTPSGNGAGNIFLSGIAVLGNPRHAATPALT